MTEKSLRVECFPNQMIAMVFCYSLILGTCDPLWYYVAYLHHTGPIFPYLGRMSSKSDCKILQGLRRYWDTTSPLFIREFPIFPALVRFGRRFSNFQGPGPTGP